MSAEAEADDRIPVKRFLRANWYRDVWLFILSTLLLGSIVVAINANQARIQDIQHERVRATGRACLDQNQRHDTALRVTAALLKRPAVPPVRKLTPAQEKAQRIALARWIGALVPKRNCALFVNQTVRSNR